MRWPTSYADLNQIEHIWVFLSRRIRQRPHHPNNVQNRIDALVRELHVIQLKAIRSMPRRCQESVDDKRCHTSYW